MEASWSVKLNLSFLFTIPLILFSTIHSHNPPPDPSSRTTAFPLFLLLSICLVSVEFSKLPFLGMRLFLILGICVLFVYIFFHEKPWASWKGMTHEKYKNATGIETIFHKLGVLENLNYSNNTYLDSSWTTISRILDAFLVK